MLAGTIHLDRGKSMFRFLAGSQVAFVVYVSLCSFVVYSCMYGFRKPFTVALYNNVFFLGISYKVCLVIAQVFGYMCSKFYGIRFIAGMKPEKRALYIILSIAIAWGSLLLFAVIPGPYNIICMFINGLPLGIVFGLVFGFLEGRRSTELLGAVLATSFIFASGLAKTTGKWLQLSYGVSDQWMPFVAGAIFVLPLIISVWLLAKTPPPSHDDVKQRTPRKPMTALERKQFLLKFGGPLIPVVIAYAVFTIVRDFCEDFAIELWAETGYLDSAAIFTKTGTIISMFTLSLIGGFFLIRNNYKAFKISHYLVIGGVCMSVIATLLFNLQYISPFSWMLMATAGIYMGYIPFNCLYFERMIAVYRIKSNVGFVMYIADAFGYLGTVVVLLVKEFMPVQYNWIDFFSVLFYGAGITGIVLIFVALQMHSGMFKKFNKVMV